MADEAPIPEQQPRKQALANVDDVTDAALAYLSLEDLLGALLERISVAISSDTAAILLLDDRRRVLVARAAKGIEEEVRAGNDDPRGRRLRRAHRQGTRAAGDRRRP